MQLYICICICIGPSGYTGMRYCEIGLRLLCYTGMRDCEIARLFSDSRAKVEYEIARLRDWSRTLVPHWNARLRDCEIGHEILPACGPSRNLAFSHSSVARESLANLAISQSIVARESPAIRDTVRARSPFWLRSLAGTSTAM